MCCVWARFVSVCGSVYVLSVGQFVVSLEELFCAMCGSV